MGRFSDRVKLVYLTIVILFALGVFVYLLDSWGIIKLEEHMTFLKETPTLVKDSNDSPSLLEKERLEKERERLEDLKTELEVARLEIEKNKRELVKLKEELEESQRGLAEEKKKMARAQAETQQRNKLIENMAGRLGCYAAPGRGSHCRRLEQCGPGQRFSSDGSQCPDRRYSFNCTLLNHQTPERSGPDHHHTHDGF